MLSSVLVLRKKRLGVEITECFLLCLGRTESRTLKNGFSVLLYQKPTKDTLGQQTVLVDPKLFVVEMAQPNPWLKVRVVESESESRICLFLVLNRNQNGKVSQNVKIIDRLRKGCSGTIFPPTSLIIVSI